MKKMVIAAALLCIVSGLLAQDYTEDLEDCNYEKDEVFIDWDNDINRRYAERKSVERLAKKKLRSFYCQNLVARDRLDEDGYVQSEGGLQLADDDEKHLIFSIKMGDIVYQDKLYIHIGPRQKLISSED
ncbi:MAG: hypothetical protein ABJG47_08100 [Ekhidna sp.]